MKKYIWWIVPLLAAVGSAALVLNRELWFDEALTVSNFMLPLSLGEIYTSYVIPNNQIVYTMLLKIFDQFYLGGVEVVFFWRLLSLAGGSLAIFILLKLRSKMDEKILTAAMVLTAWAVSPVWMNYATALRGYAWSWVFVSLALYGLYALFNSPKPLKGWIVFSAASLLAVGTVPTNLLALAGCVIYAVTWSKRNVFKDWRLYLAAFIPLAALGIFYAPIAVQFMGTFGLNEGFGSRTGAMAVTFGMYIACFGIYMIPAVIFDYRDSRNYWKLLIWFLPMIACGVLHQAPFPRVFVTLLPVLAMVLIDNISQLGKNWRLRHWGVLALGWAILQTAMVLLQPMILERSNFSPYQDDFFAPWYMAKDYTLQPTLRTLKTQPAAPKIFLSFPSDPCPLLFYAAMQDLRRNFAPDVPYNAVKSLPDHSICILRQDEAPEIYEKRFGGRLRLISENRQHKIYWLVK